MLSVNYPAYHPKKGQPTNFKGFLYEEIKKHTMRGDFKRWKKKIDEVNAGIAVLSIRQWLGKPYFSKQVIIKEIFGSIGIQEVDVEQYNGNVYITIDGRLMFRGEAPNIPSFVIAHNDGLNLPDFKAWFKKPLIGGALIHFTDFKY